MKFVGPVNIAWVHCSRENGQKLRLEKKKEKKKEEITKFCYNMRCDIYILRKVLNIIKKYGMNLRETFIWSYHIYIYIYIDINQKKESITEVMAEAICSVLEHSISAIIFTLPSTKFGIQRKEKLIPCCFKDRILATKVFSFQPGDLLLFKD